MIFGGLEIQKTKDLLFSKITRLASIHKTDVIPSLCSDHSRILFSLDMTKEGERGKGLWKFNSSYYETKDLFVTGKII